MKRSLLFFVVLLSGTVASSVAGQTKTVTNSDLEKFRQERLKAEKDYAENYAKWGFPSPDELEKQRVQSAIELSETSARLRAARLEQERLNLERRQQDAEFNYLRSLSYAPVRQYSPPYYFNYVPYGFYYSRSYRPRPRFPFKGFGNFGGQKVRPARSYLPPFVGGSPAR